MGFRRNTAESWGWGLILAQPLASCVALGKLLDHPESQLLHLQSEDNNSTCLPML